MSIHVSQLLPKFNICLNAIFAYSGPSSLVLGTLSLLLSCLYLELSLSLLRSHLYLELSLSPSSLVLGTRSLFLLLHLHLELSLSSFTCTWNSLSPPSLAFGTLSLSVVTSLSFVFQVPPTTRLLLWISFFCFSIL